MIYLCIIMLLLAYSYHDLYNSKKNKDLHLKILFWIFFLLTGLRHGNGGDTYQYRIFWDLLPTFSTASWGELTSYRYEMGWVLVSFFIKNTLGSFVFFQLLISWFFNRGLFSIVKQYANHPFVTLLLFFVVGEQFFWIEFEFMRQTVSVAIFLMWGFRYLNERKLIKYIITVIICTFFHFASVILIFFPFIWYVDFSRKKNIRNMIALILAFIIFAIGAYNLTPFVALRAYDRFVNDMGDAVVTDNEVLRIIHILYYYLFYYAIILFGVVKYNVKIKFKAALFIGVFICSMGPYSSDVLRLMFFVILFFDFVLADVLVCFSRKNYLTFFFGLIVFASISNILFIRRYCNSENTLYLYPYYSWFENEPRSHKKEFDKRYSDGTTIPLQIYDATKR